MNPRARAACVVAVALMFCAVILVVQAPSLRDSYFLSRGSGATRAKVISYDPSNHALARYTYVVDRVTYEVGEQGSSLRPGEEVMVHYALARPWVSTTSAPDRAFRDALGGTAAMIAFVAIGFPIGAFLPAGARFVALGLIAVGIVVIAQTPSLFWPVMAAILLAGLVALVIRARHRRSDNRMLGLR